MTREAAKIRLVVAACLFVGWLGWLAYLVATTHNPVILARPQFVVADLWVRGDLKADGTGPQPEINVREVIWSKEQVDKELVDKSITIGDLQYAGKTQGWTGARDYLLPLTKAQDAKKISYRLTPLPPSPGFNPATYTIRLDSTGKKKDEVAQFIAEISGLKLAAATEKMKKMGSEILKNVPPTEADNIKKKFKELDAIVTLKAEELRIYPATPQTLEQLKEIHRK